MRKTLSAVAALALMVTADAAVAEIRTAGGNVQGAAGFIRADELTGPVVEFPLRCARTNSCLYSLFIEYVPAGQHNPTQTDIFDRPEDPDDPNLALDKCFGWVRRNLAVLDPMRFPGSEHFNAGNPLPSVDSMLVGLTAIARVPGAARNATGFADVATRFLGANNEYLTLPYWRLELIEGNCLFGVVACFVRDLRTLEGGNRGCPFRRPD